MSGRAHKKSKKPKGPSKAAIEKKKFREYNEKMKPINDRYLELLAKRDEELKGKHQGHDSHCHCDCGLTKAIRQRENLLLYQQAKQEILQETGLDGFAIDREYFQNFLTKKKQGN